MQLCHLLFSSPLSLFGSSLLNRSGVGFEDFAQDVQIYTAPTLISSSPRHPYLRDHIKAVENFPLQSQKQGSQLAQHSTVEMHTPPASKPLRATNLFLQATETRRKKKSSIVTLKTAHYEKAFNNMQN